MKAGMKCVVVVATLWLADVAVAEGGHANGKSNVRPDTAGSAQQQVEGKERVLGVCHPVPNSIPTEGARGEYVVDPIYNAEGYLIKYERQNVTGETDVTVVKEPQYGTLQLITAANANSFGSGYFVAGSKSYAYFPNPGYIRKDRATFLVDIGGKKVYVVYFFQSVDRPLGNTGNVDLCTTTGLKWKISSSLDVNGPAR